MLSSDLNFGKRGELECSRPRSARILAKIKNRQIYGKVFKNGPSEICRRQLLKICSDMACLNRSYHFKFFKGCLSQISLGPFLNTLSHMFALYSHHHCIAQWRPVLPYFLDIYDFIQSAYVLPGFRDNIKSLFNFNNYACGFYRGWWFLLRYSDH